jgi:predicted nucleic acid-binding protein
MIVADTDVLIDYLEDIEPGAPRVARELELGTLATTVVTRFELLAGARTDRQQRQCGDLLAALPCLLLNEQAADRAAEVRRLLEARGATIGMADSLIAGIVITHQGILLTRNRRHFERIPDLTLGAL